MSLYVQYGCGWSAPREWLNFDASPTLRFERIPILGSLYTRNARRFPPNVRYGDIVRGLPVAPNSCNGIYCSHVLEHLSRADCERALVNTLNSLKHGGIFRLVVPDLEEIAKIYLADGACDASHKFMVASGLGIECRPRGVMGAMKILFGNSAHLWMWDERSMTDQLRTAGFSDIRRATFGDSEDPRFAEVEDLDRLNGCLAMQGRR